MASAAVFHGFAVVAVGIHLVVVGLIVLLTFALTAPDTQASNGLFLKATIALAWLAITGAGLYAWYRRSWLVLVTPLVSFAVVWALGMYGRDALGWYLTWGY